MFSLFKKKTPPKANLPTEILVPEAALAQDAAAHALTTAVVDFVNKMTHQALYRRDELPVEAMWIYHADYYLAQVNNGGHSQFIHNSGMQELIIDDIRKGLRLVGADGMATCFDQMMAWVAAKPGEAAIQNGFGERAKELDALDSEFYELGEEKFYPRVNAWLKGSGLIKPLPPTALREAFEAEIRYNPDYGKRARIQRINQLQHGLTADNLALFQIAAANQIIKDGLLEVQNLTAGFPTGHPTEETGVIWGVATNAGVLAGYLTEEKVVLAEQGAENGFSVGKTLFECDRAAAEEVVDFSATILAGGCALELLSRVNREAQLRYLAPALQELGRDKKGRPHMAYLGVTQNGQLYQMVATEHHAAIGPPNFQESMSELFASGMKRLRTEVEAHNTYVPTR